MPFIAILMCLCIAIGNISCAREDSSIEASGTLEGRKVTVSSVSSGRILSILHREGEQVAKGQVLALIDHARLDLQRGEAQSAVDLAKAQYNQLLEGARSEDLVQARDSLLQTTENLGIAETEYQRVTSLFTQGAASQRQLDEAENAFNNAKAKVSSAQAGLGKLQNLARPNEIKAALAHINQAEYSARLIQKSIDDCTVVAPISGMVTDALLEEGELASPGTGLFVINRLDPLQLTIYVSETELARIALGQKAAISIDYRPKESFPGTIIEIASEAEFTPRNIQTKDERVKLVFAVKIEVANHDLVFKPGMPADAVIALAEKGS